MSNIIARRESFERLWDCTSNGRKQPNILGDHRMMLFALPGVGNVGKAALEGLTQANQCTELVALPPYRATTSC